MGNLGQKNSVNFSNKKNWFMNLYKRNALIKLCVNSLTGAIVIETTLFLLKLILVVSSVGNSLFPQLNSGNNQIFGLATEDLVRLIDHVAFIAMFAVYFLYEFISFVVELYRNLTSNIENAETPS